MIHVRLPKDLVKKLDHQAVDWDVNRGQAVERILAKEFGSARGAA